MMLCAPRVRSTWQQMVSWSLFLVMVSCIFPFQAVAHSLFIQSGRHHVSEGRSSPLFFCFGHHFPVDDAVRREKLAYVKVVAPDQSIHEVALRDDHSLHSYLINYEQPGTYVLTAETNPGYFAMYIDKKGRERHSLKPMSTFIDNAKEVHTSMRSSQWAKTYVVSGKPSEPAPGPVGMPFELVPEGDLTTLKPGDQLAFQVYEHNQPYTGEGVWDATYSGFSTEAEDMYIQQTQTPNGHFVLPIEHAGRWFVRFFTKTEAPEESKEEFLTEKRTATFVFEVRNERKRPKIDSH